MSPLDWSVLAGTLVAIVAYGLWKSRGARNVSDYVHGGYSHGWATIGLSVMATQASAITFLSVPGQAYEDGLRFIQFYFGLPLAMVVLSIAFVPRFFRMRVLTAYEFLEHRFDLKTRQLAALLFLIQRGLSAGITIYAPSIILSAMLGWSLDLTCVVIGSLVIVYTVAGGTRAVAQTQKHQMIVMLGGMLAAFIVVLARLPPDLSFSQALHIAGTLGKLNPVETSLDLGSRYTLWSGLLGGFFLAMAYFGTDHSQVQRYLSGRSITETRLGLLFNGLLKVPMQFLILFTGVMVFVFHQFSPPPIFFNPAELARVEKTERAGELHELERAHREAFEKKRVEVGRLREALARGEQGRGPDAAADAVADAEARVRAADAEASDVRKRAKALIAEVVPRAETKDADYVFLSFVMQNLPRGLIGLLLAVIFCAAMSSTASELSALGATTVVDFYKRSVRKDASPGHTMRAAKLFTAGWGVLAVAFAVFASMLDNLIQAVNILGSLFYGTILGIFVVAFFLPRVRANAVFVGALVAEAVVLGLYFTSGIGFLWFNVIGCAVVVGVAGGMTLGRSGRGISRAAARDG